MIKIDMKFMRNMMQGEKNYIIVSSVIRMAREMGITTLMEGIETEDQRDLLVNLGCDMLQGYLYSKPQSFDALLERVQEGHAIPFEQPEEREGSAE
jgi:EAL domain-containing protein (putative c-di-GMP-specific phosphodiesterase class I)